VGAPLYARPSGALGNKGGIQDWIQTELRSCAKLGGGRVRASFHCIQGIDRLPIDSSAQ